MQGNRHLYLPEPPTMKKVVLLVEDTPDLAKNISDILRMEDYEVLIAENGVRALAILKTRKPDVIVTDVILPELDGLSFIAEIKKIKELSDIPVIILSAREIDPSKETQVDLYLKKPSGTQNLLEAIRSLVK